MSFSQNTSMPATQGHARKPVRVTFRNDADRQEHTGEALWSLRSLFAERSDVRDKDDILSSIDRFATGHGAENAPRDIIQGALTRDQRKKVRRLGFDVSHYSGLSV